jgi:hypothetical protein
MVTAVIVIPQQRNDYNETTTTYSFAGRGFRWQRAFLCQVPGLGALGVTGSGHGVLKYEWSVVMMMLSIVLTSFLRRNE